MVSQTENQTDADGVQEGVTEASPSEATELESLLKEYEGDTETSDITTPDTKTADIKPVEPTPRADIGKILKAVQPAVDFVKEIKAEKREERFKSDVKEVLDFFSEADELKDLPEKMKRGFLEAHAQETTEFKTAFENRAKDPKAWETAREAARDAFTEMVSELPGSKVRTDVAAALASVDGDKGASISDEGLSPVKKMNMTYHEWREYKEEQERLAELA